MDVHLNIEHAFAGGLHQGPQQAISVFDGGGLVAVLSLLELAFPRSAGFDY